MGTILAYKGAISNIPDKWALCNGLNGTPNLSGRFLEGVTSSPGSMKAASLPNIIGKTNGGGNWHKSTIVDGAFFTYDFTGITYLTVLSTGDPAYSKGPHFKRLGIDASRCSSIYKDDCTTVQPNSYTVLYIMKIKA